MNSIYYNLRDSIIAKSSKTFSKPSGLNKDGWSIEIKNSKDKKLKLYIFNFDTLKKYKSMYSINQIVEYKLFDTILAYTEEQLDSANWKISYSGRH